MRNLTCTSYKPLTILLATGHLFPVNSVYKVQFYLLSCISFFDNAFQIVWHGAQFYTSFKDKVDDLMLAARNVLLKDDVSAISRQMLLYAVDLQSRDFSSLPTDLQTFYKLQFAKNSSCFITSCMGK